jgi:adenylate cyclase
VGVWITFLVSSNLTRPLREIIRVLSLVRNGQFDVRVRVNSNDEIGYTGDVINEMNRGLMERDFIKETFGKYVASEVRDEILAGRIPLDGEMKEVTVLFADLRNFTPMVEAHPPKEVVRIINGYFKEMAEAIRTHHGLVLQFIGDEIEAVFGAPLSRPDHPVMAVQAALDMQGRLRSVNKTLQEQGYPPLAHGIGIHTGEVLAANIGSPDRLSYALVGDTVNLASRLQGLNKDFGTEIILSHTTRGHLDERFRPAPLPPTRVKGKSRPVEIFSLGES